MKKNVLSKKIALIIFGAILSVSAFAQSAAIKNLIPAEYYDELMENGRVLIFKDEADANGFTLLPKSVYAEKIKDGLVEKLEKNYSFMCEGLYYLKKADILKTSNSSATNITIDDVARVYRSVSDMEGMTYYSNSRNKEMVLYENAYMIENVEDKKPTIIPDMNEGNADGQVSYCLLDDASFGKNKYMLSYFQSPKELFAQFTLMDKMGKGPFNALYPGKLKINTLVIDCGDDLLMYSCTDLDSVKLPGIKNMIVDSMTARMEAIYNWFLKQF